MQQNSLWLQGEQRVHPILRGRQSADAVVIGGGLSGLTIALWLCRAGLHVTLLEAGTLGCGASACCAGLVSLSGGLLYDRLERRCGHEIASAYALTQQNALQALREWAREQGDACDWRDTDALLTSSAADEELLNREAEAMRRAGIAAEAGKATQSPLPAGYALTLRDMATVHPMKHLRHLAKRGEEHGLKIFEHSRVVALETNLAYTERGSVLAPYLVVATGYPVVNTPGWYFLRLVQKTGYLLPLRESAPFDGMTLDARGAYTLRKDRDGALFALNGRRVGANPSFDPLQRFAADYAPFLGCAPPARAYGGVETYSADGIPYIGAYGKKTPNLFVATGYGGRGLLGAMVAAQAISAKVLGLSGDGYRIYSGQRRNEATLLAEAKMAAGMGGRYGKSLLRFTAPRCPHMGCKLRYNPRARMWECPCHGSRFDDIGHVLNAPATQDAVIHRRRRG